MKANFIPSPAGQPCSVLGKLRHAQASEQILPKIPASARRQLPPGGPGGAHVLQTLWQGATTWLKVRVKGSQLLHAGPLYHQPLGLWTWSDPVCAVAPRVCSNCPPLSLVLGGSLVLCPRGAWYCPGGQNVAHGSHRCRSQRWDNWRQDIVCVCNTRNGPMEAALSQCLGPWGWLPVETAPTVLDNPTPRAAALEPPSLARLALDRI